MGAKTQSKKGLKSPVSKLKSPKTPKTKKSEKSDKDARLKTGLDPKLAEKAVEALLKFHEKQSEQNEKQMLLGNDKPIQVQFTLLRVPGQTSPKPIRIMIPHPLFKLADSKMGDDAIEEPEICLIVKEESKPFVQEMIEKFPEHMGCVKKVLGLQSLRTKHGTYAQRRELLNKYNVFMADDRILPMLSKALGKEFFKAKKLPIPVALMRKEALPFAIQKALSATFMTVSKGTCITVRAGYTGMAPKKLVENIVDICQNAALKIPHKWANIQVVSIKTPDSVALPIYNKTPEILKELAKLAGIEEDIDVPPTEPEEQEDEEKEPAAEDKKKREMQSPLLRALKKQKKDEKEKKKKEEKSKKVAAKAKEDSSDDESAEEKQELTPKARKRSSSEGSNKEEKKESAKKKKKVEESPKTPEASKKASKETKSSSKKKKETVEEDSGPQKDFIAAKKFKGSKKGYAFKMGTKGLGYYVDVKPVVNKLALEAICRMGKNSPRRGGQKKNKYKGTRRF